MSVLHAPLGARLRWHMRGAVFRAAAGTGALALAASLAWQPAADAIAAMTSVPAGIPVSASPTADLPTDTMLLLCSGPVGDVAVTAVGGGRPKVDVNGIPARPGLAAGSFDWSGPTAERLVIVAEATDWVEVTGFTDPSGSCKEVDSYPTADPKPSEEPKEQEPTKEAEEKPVVTTQTVTTTGSRTVKVNYSKKTVKDSSKESGYSKVTTKGVKGTKVETLQFTWKVTYTDGKETKREKVATKVTSSEVTKKPVTQVTTVGTKKKASAPKKESSSGKALSNSHTLSCSGGNVTVTGTAKGGGTVKVSISGAASASDSGSGSASASASGGEGTYKVTGSATGSLNLSWRYSGSGTCKAK